MIGIIGGTGLYTPDFLKDSEEIRVETQYGDALVFLGLIGNRKTAFIPRHGSGHSVPPHRVGYRRNIVALKVSGVERIMSVTSVGSLDRAFTPGGVLIPHDFIDLTSGRESTFHDEVVVHVDMTEPYCPEIREALISCARDSYTSVFERGVYVCTQGPRFETPSEVRMLRKLGGDVVGMVGCPEAALTREAGLCYASICTIANYASGLSETPLSIEDVKMIIDGNMGAMKKLLASAVTSLPQKRGCSCPRNSVE